MEQFYEKSHAENEHQKLTPDSFLVLVNKSNNHCMQEIFLKLKYSERGLSKSCKKVNFSNPVNFNGQDYEK